MNLPTMNIKDGLAAIGKALSATPTGLLTLRGGNGPQLGASLEGGFAGPASGYAFPRSSFIDGYYYTMQNASYAMIWQTQPNVPTVVQFLANQFAQVPMNLYDEDVDGTPGDMDLTHDAALAVRWPMGSLGHYGGAEWREKMATDYFVYRNAYSVIVMEPGAARPTLLHIPAYAMGVSGANQIMPKGYRILYADGTGKELTPEEVIHWRGANTIDPRVGWSPMEQLRQILIEEATRNAANIEFNKNGRVKGGIVRRGTPEQGVPEWSETARTRFEQDMAGKMKGMQSGKSPVFEDGMEWVDIGVTPREAEIILSSELSLAQVCNIYGIHPALFRPNTGTTDVKDARSVLFADVLPAHFLRFAETCTVKLLHGVFNEPTMFYAFDWSAKLDGEEDRIAKLVGAAGRPVLTLNEARKRLGLGPIAGGDHMVLMTNIVELDSDGNPVGGTGKPSTNVMPVPDPNKPAQDGSHRDGAPPAAKAFYALQDRIAAAAERGDTKAMSDLADQMAVLQVRQAKATLSSDTGGALAQPSIVSRRAATQKRAAGYAQDFAPVIQRHFARQRKAMESGSSARADTMRWDTELAADLQRVTAQHVAHEAEVVSARLMGTFDASQVQNFVKDGAAAAATAINATTQRRLDEARKGKDMTATRDEAIASVFDHAANVRVPALARHHATMVAGFAANESARQNPGEPGSIRVKEWVPSSTAVGSRHGHMAGESVLAAAPFSNGMHYPGDPTASTSDTANCGCTLDVY